MAQGVLPEDLFLDHAGFDTYDSLYRARNIFQVKSLIIVSQNFHLPRAVYIAKSLEIQAVGFSADKHVYAGAIIQGKVRETLARNELPRGRAPRYRVLSLGECIE